MVQRAPRADTAPAVDVLVPTKDRPAALAATLGCLVGQRYRPLRVVVADQGDRPCTASRAVQAVLRLLPIVGIPVDVFSNRPRRGFAHQWHVLLGHARGPYALLINDDVLVEPDLVERLVSAIVDQECGFIGSFVNAPSAVTSTAPVDQLPPDARLEAWEGPVQPEIVLPGTDAWQRHQLHFAAHLYRMCQRLGIDQQHPVLYKVAWVGGCYLVDVAKLQGVGGFDFWPNLPAVHSGEDVVAQLRLMARFGGASLAPSGAWHQEVPTTRPGDEPDAPFVLDLPSMLARVATDREPAASMPRRPA